MKLKKTTWILILGAFFTLSWVALYEIPRRQKTVKTSREQRIFNVQENQIQTITIVQPNLTLEFVASQEQNSSWSMVKPEATIANDAAIAFLTELLINGTSDRTINVNDSSLAEYGLHKPSSKVSFTTTEGQKHTIILGKSTIDDRFIYAKVMSNTLTKNRVILVDQNWNYAVNREYQEWTQDIN